MTNKILFVVCFTKFVVKKIPIQQNENKHFSTEEKYIF